MCWGLSSGDTTERYFDYVLKKTIKGSFPNSATRPERRGQLLQLNYDDVMLASTDLDE
jgi:hypothetical protein